MKLSSTLLSLACLLSNLSIANAEYSGPRETVNRTSTSANTIHMSSQISETIVFVRGPETTSTNTTLKRRRYNGPDLDLKCSDKFFYFQLEIEGHILTMGNSVRKNWEGSSIAMSTYGHSISSLLKEDGIIMRMDVRRSLLEEEVLVNESGPRSVMQVVAEIGIFIEGLLNPWPRNGYERIVKDSFLRRN
jgi:hypothetical protein